MIATARAKARADELDRIYRARLGTCPRQHVGILANRGEGTCLRRAVSIARRGADGRPPRYGT
ncbi:hypothetical protein [Streptomyces sp. NPDC017940]|uniref:hypothetical protein n=1 Tax=Streptomyces sp. NPDC017940 TaxID=3365017 RepID=UPI0037A7DB30